MKKFIIPGLVVVAALVVWGVTGWGKKSPTEFRFVELTRGDVQSVVSSTGTLQAITTVQVGTQVSGQIAEIYVDFNDRVTKDQLVARIDPLLLEQAVRASEADLERNQAELDQATRDLERITRLYEREVATETEHTTAQYKQAVAQASFKSAEINLQRARRNLSYTEIRAPIDGVVLDRTVDVGQTVAANFSAPQLFLIAEDLSQMEILAAVDESDIGQIREGQAVQFTVQAYPEKTFTGIVGQVRLQSASQENVVNYTVVIAVENPDGSLLPGMTATVEFIVEQVTDVLRVANAALRFRPTEEMLGALRAQREARRAQREAGAPGPGTGAAGGSTGDAQPGGMVAGAGGGGPGSSGQRGAGRGTGDRALLWHLDADGEVTATPVRTGITDGQYTEVRGPNLEEGLQVIAAVTTASASAIVNPFQNQQQDRRRGPPPGM